MISCPFCEHKNTEGADSCTECAQPLTHLSAPTPATQVEKSLLADRIEKLQTKEPLVVSPTDTVGDVLQLMTKAKIGCVMIVEGETLVGIFSERDALMKINTEVSKLASKPVSMFMTPNPITLEAKHKIAFALHKMHVGGYRHVPILSAGKLAGVISIRDILNYLTQQIAASSNR